MNSYYSVCIVYTWSKNTLFLEKQNHSEFTLEKNISSKETRKLKDEMIAEYL